ncbi:sorting nexin-16 isoform X6 [Myotis daubentonii]|uniref:sorting nexin-16 isoform X6 n=1 Tax=Myotis daubentonii TaxID=98922 RepID=UPI00287392B0|nr:sorting nexin-16 isoform X6 [Myotis daubentonii]
MATPYVPVPMPIGSSASSFTASRNPRSSSLGSLSASSDSSKGQLEDSNTGTRRQTSAPGQRDSASSVCSTPLLRTKFTNADSCIEYSTRPRESEEQNPEAANLEDRPSTPTILGYEVMEERAKFTVYKIQVKKNPEESWVVFRRYTDFSRLNDKAFCETLEDTNYRFQKELLEKQKEVESLKKLLGEKQLRIDTLESRIRALCADREEPHWPGTKGERVLEVAAPVLEAEPEVPAEECSAADKPRGLSEPEACAAEVEVAEVAYAAED